MYLLGLDIGSSSVKASLLDAQTGNCLAGTYAPKTELSMMAIQSGWAEQNPEDWWKYVQEVILEVIQKAGIKGTDIAAIGISYQMHGLVLLDKNGNSLRPSIIWCDSRAVPLGTKAFQSLGVEFCLSHYLNSPGNFTSSKMRWVIENEKDIVKKTWKMMLPGDFISYRLTGECSTTISGLSEGILWDFKNQQPAYDLLDYYSISKNLLPELTSTFGVQGYVMESVATKLGLKPGIPVSYRAGDQPNNAFSLNVLHPGEIAATAGTSGVVYGITDELKYDPHSRVNTFAHVNYTKENPSLGVLLCVNGTGILNSWTKNQLLGQYSYPELNDLAGKAPIGSDGLVVLPFGNGAERMLGNQQLGASIQHLEFNRHTTSHLLRAVQEGIVFSLVYGIETMQTTGVKAKTIRAGKANMFLSPIFAEAFSTLTQSEIELIHTDGAQGAARGAGLGSGIYKNDNECFIGLEIASHINPLSTKQDAYQQAYQHWKNTLKRSLES